MRNGETFIFQLKDDKFQIILFDGWNIESEIKQTKTNDYFDLIFSSNWSGGGRVVSHYKFNGRVFKAQKCFSEDQFIEKNGEMIKVDKAVTTHTTCGEFNNILK